MAEYPEHEKLSKVADRSQACGEFLEWLQYHKTYHICEWRDSRVDPNSGERLFEGMYLVNTSIADMLGEFFGIDQDKIEAEKRQMLASLREQK